MLIEIASRAVARAILDYELKPQAVEKMVLGRLSALLTEALECAQTRLPPELSVVK